MLYMLNAMASASLIRIKGMHVTLEETPFLWLSSEGLQRPYIFQERRNPQRAQQPGHLAQTCANYPRQGSAKNTGCNMRRHPQDLQQAQL